MDSVIYLEPDEEITSVIEKLKRSKSPIVGIVAPRNAVLLQSVVNLKLLKRQAATLKKEMALVTADKIGQNLALRTGITVYANVHDTEPLEPLTAPKPDSIVEDDLAPAIPISPSGAFKVHRYDERSDIVDAKSAEQLNEDENIADFSSHPIEQSDPQQSESEPEIPDEKSEDKPETEKEHKPTQKDEIRSDPAIQKTHIKSNYLKIVPVLVAALIIIVVVGYLALSSVSKATVKIVVSAEPIKQELEVTVTKDRTQIDAVNNLIPGRLIESIQQNSQKYDASGKKDIGEKTTGKITLYNAYSYTSTITIAKGTKVTSGDKNYYTQASATIPKATPGIGIDQDGQPIIIPDPPGSVEVDILASSSGAGYNIQPSKFTISGYSASKVYGENKTALAGGSTKEVTIITQADIDKATSDITKSLYAKALTDLKTKSGQATFLQEALKNEIVETSSNTEVGTEASDFTFTAKTKSSILIFDNGKLNDLITQDLTSKISKDQSLLTTDTKNLKIIVISSDPQAGLMKISLTASGKIVPKIDESKIKADLAGKTRSQVESYFQDTPDIKMIDIKLNPPWWLKKMPKTIEKINVDISTKNK
ncbi:MAG: hypothetical protein Q7S37_03030 [bacterium]|nr:hypothetical protein [bacterium]